MKEQSNMSTGNQNNGEEDNNGIDEQELKGMGKVRKQVKTNKIQELFLKLSKKDKNAEAKTSDLQVKYKYYIS